VNAALVVFCKELRDAARDRRAWMIVIVSSMIAGPAVLLVLSNFIAGVQERAAKKEIVMAGVERVPTLLNFLQRAGATVVEAPADYESQLRAGSIGNGVVVPPVDFEAKLARGETVEIDFYFDDSHDKAQPVVRAGLRMINAFNRELGTQRLLARGVSPQLLAAIAVEEKNLASSGGRGAQLLFIIPWVTLLVSVAGSISVAIDVTAGERERGSLEPLLMNPVDMSAVVLGKWAVVGAFSALVVLLTLAGFMAAMQFVRDETLSAVMQFGAREVILFVAMLLPFCLLVAAVNMLAATWGRSFKEAQTYVSYFTLLVNLAPVVPLFLSNRDAAWQLAVPSLGQLMVLMRALRGEAVGTLDVLVPGAICLALAALCLVEQGRLLRREEIVFSRT
jgi:sodium transport system permease protein